MTKVNENDDESLSNDVVNTATIAVTTKIEGGGKKKGKKVRNGGTENGAMKEQFDDELPKENDGIIGKEDGRCITKDNNNNNNNVNNKEEEEEGEEVKDKSITNNIGQIKSKNSNDGGGNKDHKSVEITTEKAEEKGGRDMLIGGEGKNEEEEDGEDQRGEEEADVLIDRGKEYLKNSEFDDAVSSFSEALQICVKRFGAEDECDPRLGKYYLEYGNALLRQAEYSNDLFKLSSEARPPSQEPANIKVEGGENTTGEEPPREEVSNEELAWEVFELSRICYSRSLDDLKKNGSLPFKDSKQIIKMNNKTQDNKNNNNNNKIDHEGESTSNGTYDKTTPKAIIKDETNSSSSPSSSSSKTPPFQHKPTPAPSSSPSSSGGNKFDELKRLVAVVEDAAFINLRLGDILLLEEQFEGAVTEFRSALDVLRSNGMPYTYCQSSLISLGQALLFAGQAEESLATFKEALQSIEDHMSGVGGAKVAASKRADFEATVEDLKIQIQELQKNIDDGVYDPNSTTAGPSKEASEIVKTSTNSEFDKPSLAADTGVVNLGVVKGKRARDSALKDKEVKMSPEKKIKIKDDDICSSAVEISPASSINDKNNNNDDDETLKDKSKSDDLKETPALVEVRSLKKKRQATQQEST